eukprot:6473371-Prymnesium_polylepis.1
MVSIRVPSRPTEPQRRYSSRRPAPCRRSVPGYEPPHKSAPSSVCHPLVSPVCPLIGRHLWPPAVFRPLRC